MLKGYEEYMPFPNFWLDSIPQNWKSLKIKRIFDERTEKGHPNEQLLAATQNKGVIPKTLYENRTVVAQKGFELLKFVKVGDFVISLRSFQGGIEYAHYQGIISPAYTIMIPSKKINPDYFRYLAKSKLFIELLKNCVTGIREGQNIDYSKLKNFELPLPTSDEQNQIVRYLDAKVAKINRLISAKKKEIALLKEHKQAIITRAITKGLDENVEMKDSGVEWIGEIRFDCDIVPLKTTTRNQLMYGANSSGITYSKDLPRYVRITDITSDGDLKNIGLLSLPKELSNKYLLSEGDILFARSGATVGKSFLYHNRFGKCCFAGYLIKYSPNIELVLPEFVHYYTYSGVYLQWLKQIFIQATIQNISAEKYKQLPLILPPIHHQENIVNYLNHEIIKIDNLIDYIIYETDLFKEYKTRLISDVVTGKVDVRGIHVEDVSDVELIEEFDEEIVDEFDAETSEEENIE